MAVVRRTIAVVGVVVLSVSAMAGCTLLDEFLPREKGGPTSQSAPHAHPKTETTPSPRRQADLGNVAVPRRPEPFVPDSLVGASEGEAIGALGRPAAVIDNPPAIVWEYPSENCQVSLFFYNDVATNVFRVLTYKVTPKSEVAAACFEAVRRKRG